MGPSSRSRSLADDESLQSLRRLIVRLDVLYPGVGRSKSHGLDHRRGVGVLALEDRLDGAVLAVADPAGHAAPLCVPSRPLAKEDALDAALHHHPATNGHVIRGL